jgi:hypothetical protein
MSTAWTWVETFASNNSHHAHLIVDFLVMIPRDTRTRTCIMPMHV